MRRVLVLCFLLVAALAALAAPAHAQQDAGQFAAEPAPGSSLAATGDYFLLRPAAGATVKQALVIRNDYKRAIDIRLAAVDATTGSYGGVSYGLPGETPGRVGKWIALERRSLRLAAGASAQVAFTVSIPAGVTSGEHVGGLAIWSPAPAGKQETERSAGQTGAAVTIQTRRVIAVLVRLPGAAEPQLAVTGVTPAPRSNGLYLEVGIENRGSGLTKASGVISLPEESFRRRFEVDSFVPGTSITYPIEWSKSPREGEHRARVELRYGSRTTSWEGTFTVGDEIVDELVDRGAIVPGASGTVEESGRSDAFLAAVAAAAAAALVSVLAGAVWLVTRRRRRRHPRPAAPSSPRDASRVDQIRSDPGKSSVPLLPPAADERSPRGDGGTAPARAAATADAGVGHRVPVLRAPARTDLASLKLENPEKESARAAAALGAAAVVGGALWLLVRARNRGHP